MKLKLSEYRMAVIILAFMCALFSIITIYAIFSLIAISCKNQSSSNNSSINNAAINNDSLNNASISNASVNNVKHPTYQTLPTYQDTAIIGQKEQHSPLIGQEGAKERLLLKTSAVSRSATEVLRDIFWWIFSSNSGNKSNTGGSSSRGQSGNSGYSYNNGSRGGYNGDNNHSGKSGSGSGSGGYVKLMQQESGEKEAFIPATLFNHNNILLSNVNNKSSDYYPSNTNTYQHLNNNNQQLDKNNQQLNSNNNQHLNANNKQHLNNLNNQHLNNNNNKHLNQNLVSNWEDEDDEEDNGGDDIEEELEDIFLNHLYEKMKKKSHLELQQQLKLQQKLQQQQNPLQQQKQLQKQQQIQRQQQLQHQQLQKLQQEDIGQIVEEYWICWNKTYLNFWMFFNFGKCTTFKHSFTYKYVKLSNIPLFINMLNFWTFIFFKRYCNMRLKRYWIIVQQVVVMLKQGGCFEKVVKVDEVFREWVGENRKAMRHLAQIGSHSEGGSVAEEFRWSSKHMSQEAAIQSNDNINDGSNKVVMIQDYNSF